MTNSLNSGDSLTPGSSMASSNNRFSLDFQNDGNLVLYRNDGVAIWASNTANSGATKCDFLADGNLVILKLFNIPWAVYLPIWSTGTNGHPGSRFVLQDDGNLVIYDQSNNALWASGSIDPPTYKELFRGFADIHNHQFANLGFGGGGVIFGGAYGPINTTLPHCNKAHGPGGTNDIVDKAISTAMKHGRGGHLVGGYPEFDGWPRFDSYTHQSVYEDWLYRAVQGGLRLMVMLAVNNEFLCGKVWKPANRTCNDMEAVDLQIDEAYKFQDYIDAKNGGPCNGWYRIVKTPAEARAVMNAGKLAVVLGIEVDYPFGSYPTKTLSQNEVKTALKSAYDRGVRHLFPIHFGDNLFGGASYDKEIQADANDMLGTFDPIKTGYVIAAVSDTGQGYQFRGGKRNLRGLTPLGQYLISEMMGLGMIIDVDHTSFKMRQDIFAIVSPKKYPVVSGHTGFVEINNGDKRHEGQLLGAEVDKINSLGGIVAVIPHQGDLSEVRTFNDGSGSTVVSHGCGNSSETLAQAYLYAIKKMGNNPVAFGTDFNGMAGLPGPRFGAEACPGTGATTYTNKVTYPFIADASGALLPNSKVGQKKFDFNTDGLAHVGMLPDLIEDFKALGLTNADLDPLLNSAEGYIRVWERAVREASGRIVGDIYHTIRFTSSWQPWGSATAAVRAVSPVDAKNLDYVETTAASSIGNDFHLMVINQLEELHHTLRWSDGKWRHWDNVSVHALKSPGKFYRVACAGVGNDLHVVAISQSEELYHTIRYTTITWQDWGNVSAAVANNPGKFQRVACAGIGNELHVVGVGKDGNLYHTIRFTTSWQPWGNVTAAVSNGPGGRFEEVSCASIGPELHVVARHSSGNIYHTIRYADGSWQPWGNVTWVVQNGPRAPLRVFAEVSCAAAGPNLHLVGLYVDGTMYHTIRYADGSWQPWGNVSTAVQSSPIRPGVAYGSLSCAGINNELHLVSAAKPVPFY